jgi:hypothetical protein
MCDSFRNPDPDSNSQTESTLSFSKTTETGSNTAYDSIIPYKHTLIIQVGSIQITKYNLNTDARMVLALT